MKSGAPMAEELHFDNPAAAAQDLAGTDGTADCDELDVAVA